MMSERILHNAISGHVIEYKTCVFYESLSDIKDRHIYNCTGSYGLPESYKEGLSCYTCMHAIYTQGSGLHKNSNARYDIVVE